MTYSQFDPAAQNRVPWNFGAKIGPKRPFNQKQFWAIRFFLDREERTRDRALFDSAIDSKLRGCDLVELKIGDLVSGPEIRTRATITQRKTGRPVQFEIAADARTRGIKSRRPSVVLLPLAMFETSAPSDCIVLVWMYSGAGESFRWIRCNSKDKA